MAGKTETNAVEEKGSFFKRAFMQGEGFNKGIKASIAASKLQTSFKTTYTDIASVILEKAESLNNKRSDVENYDLKGILMLQDEIKDYIETTRQIVAEFEFMFDKKMKVDISIEETLTEALGAELTKSLMKA